MNSLNIKKAGKIFISVILSFALFAGILGSYALESGPEIIADSQRGDSASRQSERTPSPSSSPYMVVDSTASTASDTDTEPEPPVVPNDNYYVANYEVVDYNGNPLARVVPGDKMIIAVTVVDERVDVDQVYVETNGRVDFGTGNAGNYTNYIQANMGQGAFSIASSSSIVVRVRNPVGVKSGNSILYKALCYTIWFRDVTYVGGDPAFSFDVNYTDNNEAPLPGRSYAAFSIPRINQATDDIPAPNIILNSRNYGKVATVGEVFSLSTSAVNTSNMLELDNVSVKIELPTGLNMASGNSQVLIGHVGKSGTINHTFSLKADGVPNDTTSLPVKIIYSFEAVVGGERTRFTSEQNISINVQQAMRFSIQNVDYVEEMYLGDENYISVSLVNKGKSRVNNVSAEIVSDDFTGREVEFLGNIDPGSSSDAEFTVSANEIGEGTGTILITYEDSTGTEFTFEEPFTINVLEPMDFDPGMDVPVPEEPRSSNVLPWVIGAVVLACAGGSGFWYYKKKKKKRQRELEDEDEDI